MITLKEDKVLIQPEIKVIKRDATALLILMRLKYIAPC